MIDEILQKYGLKMDDLNAAEGETLKSWLSSLSKQELGVEKIREYVRAMLSGVENELSEGKLPRWRDIFLKARMRNYLLLIAFLETPERAKKALENQLKNLK